MSGIMAVMIGGANSLPRINDYYSFSSNQSPFTIALYSLRNTGQILATQGDNTAISAGAWLPYGGAGNYEARVTLTSGTLTSGTAGSWLPCSSNLEWTRAVSFGAAAQCTFLLEIRSAASGQVLASATITLDADAS